jgi:hypothetical protein
MLRCARANKSRIVITKPAFSKKKILLASKLELSLWKKPESAKFEHSDLWC